MKRSCFICAAAALLLLLPTQSQAEDAVAEVMDGLVTRLYATLDLESLYALDDEKIQSLITREERRVFATKHWYFDVDVPVIVSVMRHTEQAAIPFWLAESGFEKTSMMVKNMEGWEYEVWQRAFPAGRVELGINGFDNHRPHYLVCVGPQTPGAKVTLSGFHPANQTIETMAPGALTYHDWTELVLTDVPQDLLGQQLLPSIRGRGKEAGLVGSFRKTPFPSTETPQPVFLTWSDDPHTTQNVQWRTSTAVTDGVVRYRKQGEEACQEAGADFAPMEDRMLANDRYCHWFTAVLRDLEPGATYEYQVGSPGKDAWIAFSEFKTEPVKPGPFTFLYCSDTHSNPQWGELITATLERYPEAAFTTISGDLVGTGLEREDWDEFFTYGQPVFKKRPVMPAIGNHDAQLGLGAGMYLEIFGLPENGPAEIPTEAAYTFTYSNAEFFVLDVMSPTAPQAAWLRQALAKSTADWKIAVFHFPLYSNEEAYPHLVKAWGSLFDEYHLDLVLTGHVHTHMRTYPMRGDKRVDSSKEGTVYVTSISIPSYPARTIKPDFAEVWVGGGLLCNVIAIDGDRLSFKAVARDGSIKDEFVLNK